VTDAPVVVVGDVMLDVDIDGVANRLTPDAPVPVLQDATRHCRPGGAALAAALAAAGRPVILLAPVCEDDAGAELQRLLPDSVELIPLSCTGSTAVKTRLRAGQHPVARLDSGSESNQVTSIPDAVPRALAAAGSVLVADYGRGVTADPRLRQLLSEAADHRPLVWDPHPRGAEPVLGTLIATPNEKESALFSGLSESGAGLRRVSGHAAALLRRWQLPWLSVTLGSRGAMLHDGTEQLFVGAQAVQSGDSCGAGDAFAAAMAVALGDGALPSEAVQSAVQAATRFVAAGGAAAFGRPEPAPAAGEPVGARELSDRVRVAGGTVVATGGCFDLLHTGHVAVLEAARALGDCLIVCLNSDRSVRRLKGPGRPLQPEQDRAAVLAALRCVDAVVIFEEDTPAEVLATFRPDVWVKGGDYAGMELPEGKVLAGWDGIAVTVPYQPGRSTTALVQRVRQA
jgi:D-beta-D-heptose 7-phosphate kinase/D-beta-D-heptose 1-phosphate adenosyltransferase